MEFSSVSLTHRNAGISEVSIVFRLALAVVLGILTFRFLSMSYDQYYGTPWIHRILHMVNLPIHEFGHILFRPWPRVIVSLGGSLTQVLCPLFLAAAIFFTSRDPFGASVGLWWMFENILDCSSYIADARAGELPLLGGNFGKSSPYGFHDWNYILTETGLLQYDQFLGKLAYWMGILGMAAVVVFCLYILFQEYKILDRMSYERSRR